MIALFTDFGHAGPYVGQLHAVFAHLAPAVPVIDLFHEVPNFDIHAGAYLLPSLAREFESGTVFVGVVDPGVGGERAPLMIEADGRWYVGPDNGLFEIVVRRAARSAVFRVAWRPERLSASFHGRDLFAPVAATLARGERPAAEAAALSTPTGEWPEDLAQILYIDHYGNAVTGLRATGLSPTAGLVAAGHELRHARVFSEVAPGEAFWYENANGLVEIAVNRDSAAACLGLAPGQAVAVKN